MYNTLPGLWSNPPKDLILLTSRRGGGGRLRGGHGMSGEMGLGGTTGIESNRLCRSFISISLRR